METGLMTDIRVKIGTHTVNSLKEEVLSFPNLHDLLCFMHMRLIQICLIHNVDVLVENGNLC